MLREPWWRSAVIYQIYPRSFADSNGDGIGDLRGVISRLDYLSETLGIDAIWLSPFYPSPQRDFGYDVADYINVDPAYGTLEDFDRLVAACHARRLRVVVDFVPNHTSSDHPWFVESRSSRDNARRDWYVWEDGRDGGPPNNWLSVFGGPAWEWDGATSQWYLHSFLDSQPDLNWRNPKVRATMANVLRFWMGRGVDGFRIDVAHYIGKDPDLSDNPPAPEEHRSRGKDMGRYESQLHVNDFGHPDTHRFFREIRAVLDEGDDQFSVGEIHEFDRAKWAAYHGEGDELHQVYDFSLLYVDWTAPTLRRLVGEREAALPPGAWPCQVLGNHDEPRLVYRRGQAGARLGAMLLLTLRGTPTIYYGDELGMSQVEIPAEQQLDPWGQVGEVTGRDGSRTPMQWTPGPNAGFTGADTVPWLPVHPDSGTVNVDRELGNPGSFLNLYRELLRVRRSSPALTLGTYEPLGDPDGDVFTYLRSADGESYVVALNFTDSPATTRVGSSGRLALTTSLDRTGEPVDDTLRLAPMQGAVVRLDP